MLNKVGFGVIGVGFWGRNHSRVISELNNADLIAVCDKNPIRAKTVGEKYNVDWYTTTNQMLERPNIEAVCICTPTISHAEIALKAIEYEKSILVEKPIADTVTKAKEIIRKAEQNNVLMMTGFLERFNPGTKRLKCLIQSGRLGDVVLVFARRIGSWPQRTGDVGVIKDLAIHDIDITRFILEEEPISIYARAGRLVHNYEDYAQIMMGFKGIKTAFIEANWLTPKKNRLLTITGSKAVATVNYLTQEITIEDNFRLEQPKNKWEEPLML